jgi:muconolactone delta-isomerase
LRFLVKTTTNRDQALRRGPDVLRQLFSDLRQWYHKMNEVGKLEAVYPVAGQATGFAVWNVDSPEELDQMMIEHPLAAMTDREIWCISSFEGEIDRALQGLRRL